MADVAVLWRSKYRPEWGRLQDVGFLPTPHQKRTDRFRPTFCRNLMDCDQRLLVLQFEAGMSDLGVES